MDEKELERESKIQGIERKIPKECNTCDFFSGNTEDGIGIRPAWCCNETSELYKKNVDECEVHECHTCNMELLLDDEDLDWYDDLLDLAKDK